MRKYLIVLAVALLALSVGASQAVAAPTAVAAKKCKKKQKAKKKKCKKKKKKQGAQGAPGQQGPSGTGTPGTPGTPATTKVTALDGNPFEATNDTVSLTPDGVEFGPYADSGACTPGVSQGSLFDDELNGQPLSDVQSLIYTARYTADDDTGGVGSPYLRIFLEGDMHDAIFSPNSQVPNPDVSQGPFHTWAATSGLWRYDDDGGSGGQYGVNGAPFSQVVDDHGDEIISGLYITTGCSAGHNLSALLREWKVNQTDYSFGS
jgi:hypothetical protein